MKKKIILVGAKGKMGVLLHEKLKDNFEIIAIEKQDNIWQFEADLVVDFGSAESSVQSAEFCLQHKTPLIVGSTGQSKSQLEMILKVGKVAPVMKASNFSFGILLLKQIVKELADFADEVCLFEKHHKNKKDAPSGTAVELTNIIEKKLEKKIQVSSQRGGEETGTHVIDFYLSGELISISHQAFSREPFVKGAVFAIGFMLNQSQPGVYDFAECINLNCNK